MVSAPGAHRPGREETDYNPIITQVNLRLQRMLSRSQLEASEAERGAGGAGEGGWAGRPCRQALLPLF